MLVWEDFIHLEFPDPDWIVEGVVPRQGITLLWGKESIGKTPICWYLAKAAAAGESFFGQPVPQKVRTLFLELDMTTQAVHSRVKNIPMPGVFFSFHNPIVSEREFELEKMQELFRDEVELKPEFVIIDSLRASHPLIDTESTAPKVVYTRYRELFPGAAMLFIHHERKSMQDDHRPDHESFSGSKAWANDSDHRIRVHTTNGQFPLQLDVVRSKVGESDWSMKFHLEQGTVLTSTGNQLDAVTQMLTDGLTVGQIQKKLSCSRATAFRRIKEAKRMLGESDE